MATFTKHNGQWAVSADPEAIEEALQDGDLLRVTRRDGTHVAVLPGERVSKTKVLIEESWPLRFPSAAVRRADVLHSGMHLEVRKGVVLTKEDGEWYAA